jgi:hypothetical protein
MRYNLSQSAGGTQQSLTTTYKTQVAITSATGATTLRRAWIYEAEFSADGAPADNVVTYILNRQNTGLGTATTVTPAPLDTSDAASLITARANHTAEPTVIAATALYEKALNQRASFTWYAAPNSELVVPAIDLTGIGLRAKSPAYTSTVMCGFKFLE